MGVVNIITARAPDGDHAHAGVTAGTQGALRTDLSFTVSLGGKRSVQGAASFWRQEGTRFAADPREDVLTAARGANISDGIQPGENLTAPQAGARPQVNGYGPSYNLFLKYQHDDGSSLRVLAVRGESQLQRTHRQSLYLDQPHTQPPVYVNQRLLFDLEKRWGDSRTLGAADPATDVAAVRPRAALAGGRAGVLCRRRARGDAGHLGLERPRPAAGAHAGVHRRPARSLAVPADHAGGRDPGRIRRGRAGIRPPSASWTPRGDFLPASTPGPTAAGPPTCTAWSRCSCARG